MMKIIKTVLFVLFILTVSVFGQDCKSSVKITTNDSASVIFVDKEFIGNGSAEIELTKGIHPVSIRKSLVIWNSFEINDTVIIEECPKDYSFRYDVPKTIFVDTEPQNARVIKNDSVVGYTPLFMEMKNLSSIKFKKDGLITAPDFNLLKNGEVQKIDFKPVPPSEIFTDTDLFKVLVGTAAVLGATAAYFKLKADNKYDDYLINKDKGTLDEVDRLDAFAGVAFGLLQINFGYLVYRFITD